MRRKTKRCALPLAVAVLIPLSLAVPASSWGASKKVWAGDFKILHVNSNAWQTANSLYCPDTVDSCEFFATVRLPVGAKPISFEYLHRGESANGLSKMTRVSIYRARFTRYLDDGFADASSADGTGQEIWIQPDLFDLPADYRVRPGERFEIRATIRNAFIKGVKIHYQP